MSYNIVSTVHQQLGRHNVVKQSTNYILNLISRPAHFVQGKQYPPALKDFTFLVPQRLGVQQILLELSSFYRPGNMPEPGLLQPLTRYALREKLASDFCNRLRLRRLSVNDRRQTSIVSYVKGSRGVLGAVQRAVERKNFQRHVKNMEFRGTWMDLSDIALPLEVLEPVSTVTAPTAGSRSPSPLSPLLSIETPTTPATISFLKSALKSAQSRRDSQTGGATTIAEEEGGKEWGERGGGEILSTVGFNVSRSAKSMGNVTSRDAATAEKMVSEFVGGLGLYGNTEIYPATFTEALARKGIECLEHMADDMIREADEHKKGFLTVDELKGAIVKASRLKRLLRAITHRWKHDSNYQACTSREVEGNYTNIEQDVDMCGLSFVMTVERGKLDNADTRRRAPRIKHYTWSGLPILEEDNFQRVRAKTVKSRQLHDSLQTPHAEVRFRRLPLHFCCANQLHPEAAVMVRDVLAASERGAQITDHEGRLPLHVACMNESYMSASMVRLLLRAYPLAVQVRDNFGYLPLHLCLQHNHGDAAFEIVDTLLDVYPHAARASSAQLHAGDMAIHLSLDNTSVFAHKIISRLLAVYPEALVQRGNAGLTLLHRFCWISHPCPFEVQKKLEARGISSLLRAPPLQKPGTHTKWDSPAHTITPGLPHTPCVWSERYCAVKKMKAILRSAKHYFPHCLNKLDHHGALPIHYLCQMGGPCSQGLLRALIELHPHSLHVQDNKGNLPFHLAIGCEQPELAEILAHFASSQHSISRLGVPNHRDQLPSQVSGAWGVGGLGLCLFIHE